MLIEEYGRRLYRADDDGKPRVTLVVVAYSMRLRVRRVEFFGNEDNVGLWNGILGIRESKAMTERKGVRVIAEGGSTRVMEKNIVGGSHADHRP